jgi:hypothetical protein
LASKIGTLSYTLTKKEAPDRTSYTPTYKHIFIASSKPDSRLEKLLHPNAIRHNKADCFVQCIRMKGPITSEFPAVVRRLHPSNAIQA